jgi:hypothetical protein
LSRLLKNVDCFIEKLKSNIFIFLGFALGWAVLVFPLQHHLTLARFQHYGIALFVFCLGYALNCLCTWRSQSFWYKLSNLLTALFFCLVSLIFYCNPWLDTRNSEQTQANNLMRAFFIAFYLAGGFVLMVSWLIAVGNGRRKGSREE